MIQQLKQAWEDKPAETAIGVASVVMMGVKIMDTVSSIQSKRAYAKNMNRRSKRMR